MKIILSALITMVVLSASIAAFPQSEIVEIEKPFMIQSLSGTIRLARSSEGIRGVLVESCSSDWKTVMASTTTNGKGHFSFQNASSKEMHFLRLSLRGAHTLLIKARISKSGDKELFLMIDVKE